MDLQLDGSEYAGETIDEYTKKDKEEEIQYRLPFGGGSGAGISINPVAFLVVQNENVKLITVNHNSAIDKLLDYVPDLIEKTNDMLNGCIENKKLRTEAILKRMQHKQEESREKENKNDIRIKQNINNNEVKDELEKNYDIESMQDE